MAGVLQDDGRDCLAEGQWCVRGGGVHLLPADGEQEPGDEEHGKAEDCDSQDQQDFAHR